MKINWRFRRWAKWVKNKMFHRCVYSYLYSMGYKKCIDCGKVESVDNVVKHQR